MTRTVHNLNVCVGLLHTAKKPKHDSDLLFGNNTYTVLGPCSGEAPSIHPVIHSLIHRPSIMPPAELSNCRTTYFTGEEGVEAHAAGCHSNGPVLGSRLEHDLQERACTKAQSTCAWCGHCKAMVLASFCPPHPGARWVGHTTSECPRGPEPSAFKS